MANIGHIIIFSLIGGVISLIGGLILLGNQNLASKLANYGTPFAAGALLAAVFLDLLNEGVELAEPYTVLVFTLVGILLFFLAERFLRWFHHHHEHKGSKKNTEPGVSLIVLGDTLHNALDGVAIAAAFLVSVPTGIVTTLAVAAHEIPQEIGDFALLLKKGMSRTKVLLVNVASALATLLFAIIAFVAGSEGSLPIGALLGLSAGFLLYIAMSDIIPSIHEETPKRKLFDFRAALLILGVLIVGVSINLAHNYIEADHSHEGESSQHVQDDGHDEEETHSD